MEVAQHHPARPGGSQGSPLPVPSGDPGGSGGGGENPSNRKKTGLRKRTKTGCLTCRRRRIKCDEGKPICNNCIKSKRSCEGYNKRVIFKDPMGAHPLAGPYGAAGFLEGDEQHFLEGYAGQNIRLPSQGLLPLIAPKPPTLAPHYQSLPSHSYGSHMFEVPIGADPVSFDLHSGVPEHGAYHAQAVPSSIPNARVSSGHHGFSQYSQSNETPIRAPQSPRMYPVAPKLEYRVDNTTHLFEHGNLAASMLEQSAEPQPEYTGSVQFRPLNHEGGESSAVGTRRHLHPTSQKGGSSMRLATSEPVYYQIDDDSDSCVESDAEMEDPSSFLAAEIGYFSGSNAPSGSQLRFVSATSANTELVESIKALDYMCASELKDEAKRRIFGHFIKVTGPSMSLYDRHPFDPAKRKNKDRAMADEGCSIWTSTFPMKSFRHSGLLCAILAVGSLQIAHLRNIPPTVAIRQYAMAIRRIKKYTNDPTTFTDPAMLAAILLLGYFEVWNSEHAKWCSHLLGARNIFRHIPLRSMTRRILPIEAELEKENQIEQMGVTGIGQPMNPYALDCELLTIITGVRIVPEDYGLGPNYRYDHETEEDVTETQIDEYENFRDLFWWYCKMEVYQSILGATKLLMDYTHWTQCPPRAPMGHVDGVYGTYDHLMLLLGRLANFASSDWPRKRRVDQTRKTDSKSSPPFPGMVPTKDSVRPSMNFGTATEKPTRGDPTDQRQDPSFSMKAALEEWDDIRHAFEVFETRLSKAFQPLSAEYSDRRDRPFGGVLQYRTFSVAGIWMNFYMGMIHLHRSHPTMPAAAIESAGRSAHVTAAYANKIGRIAIGLSGDCSNVTEINTLLGAAFIESAFCMFVAAVQVSHWVLVYETMKHRLMKPKYRDDDQRHWVVGRMHDISRLTGWRSAREIANGCESTWIKAAQLGKGPPYTRLEDLDDTTGYSSVWDRPRRIDKKRLGMDPDSDMPTLEQSRRAHYAVGLLALDEDFAHLELK